MNRESTLRGLDAGFNRLGEALRAIEDRFRFDLPRPQLAERARALRHGAAELRRRTEQELGLALALFRSVERDSGALAKPIAPHATIDELIAANFARARESSRSIEEALRFAAPQCAARAEEIRYGVYALEETVARIARRAPRLADARLYVIITTELCSAPPLAVAERAIRGGAEIVQLREKSMPDGEFLALARELRALTAEAGALFIVNDRVAIAERAGADGVHLGQEDLPASEARALLGPSAIIGLSTHAAAEARRAEPAGADYIGVGPIYETKTKEHRQAVGLDYIPLAAKECALPGFAIGGVNRTTIGAVLEAGARRVAICTAIIGEKDVEGSARFFHERIEAAAKIIHSGK